MLICLFWQLVNVATKLFNLSSLKRLHFFYVIYINEDKLHSKFPRHQRIHAIVK